MAKILIVDDKPAQRARLKHLLETAGYSVATAPDAIQGLVSVTRDPPDLILSDIPMPRMDGFTFEMAGAAAHEPGQPMGAIPEQARHARRQAGSTEVKQEAQTIAEHVQQMAQIVNQMRRTTRYEYKPAVGSSKLLNHVGAASSS